MFPGNPYHQGMELSTIFIYNLLVIDNTGLIFIVPPVALETGATASCYITVSIGRSGLL